MTYIVTEPAPQTTNYVRSGRGGAGNIRTNLKPSSVSALLPRSQPQTNSSSGRRFFSGIGGAGNAHHASERPSVSLETEFRRAAAREKTTVGHCGIGGAGNVFPRRESTVKSKYELEGEESDDSSRSSVSTSPSFTNKLWGRVHKTLSRD